MAPLSLKYPSAVPTGMVDLSDPDAVAEHLVESEDMDPEVAAEVADEIAAEATHEQGDPEELLASIREGAGMVLDTALELVSGVDVPAVDSKFVMMKSDREEFDKRASVPVLLDKQQNEEDRVAFAPAMIPREPDKEGDVVSTATVEESAWQFLKDDGGIDTDHNLIDGKGEVVESWVLKEKRTFDLPGDGGTETYPAGTWMLGIQWEADPWERIKAGEIQGLSIYGTAEQVALKDAHGITVTAEKQEFGEWPWPRNKDGLKQCEEELAGEVENEFAVCRAWAAEAGIDISEDGQSVKSSDGEHGDMGQDTDDPEADDEATDTEQVADDVDAEADNSETETDTEAVESDADEAEDTETVADDADDTETVTVESEAMTVSVETAKAEHDEVMQVLAALGETDDMDVVEQAANMLMGESDGDMDDEEDEDDEEEMDEAADDDDEEEVVDGTDDHEFAEDEGDDAGGEDTDDVDKSADEDEDAIDRAEDDVMWKGTRGMPEGAQDAIAKDASDGDGSDDPTRDRASVLEADK